MITFIKKYAAVLLPAVVLIWGGLKTVIADPSEVGDITFAILVAGVALTFGVKLVDVKWQGILKTGIPIITALLSALLPYAVNHTITLANVPLIAIALVNVLLTELGVQLRLDPDLIDAGTYSSAAENVITSVPAAASTPEDATSASAVEDGGVGESVEDAGGVGESVAAVQPTVTGP